MKKEIHPQNYRPVLFIDNSNGAEFIISSTVETKETAKAKADKKVDFKTAAENIPENDPYSIALKALVNGEKVMAKTLLVIAAIVFIVYVIRRVRPYDEDDDDFLEG